MLLVHKIGEGGAYFKFQPIGGQGRLFERAAYSRIYSIEVNKKKLKCPCKQHGAILATRDNLICPEGKWTRVLDAF